VKILLQEGSQRNVGTGMTHDSRMGKNGGGTEGGDSGRASSSLSLMWGNDEKEIRGRSTSHSSKTAGLTKHNQQPQKGKKQKSNYQNRGRTPAIAQTKGLGGAKF